MKPKHAITDDGEKTSGWRGSRGAWLAAAKQAFLETGLDAGKIQPLGQPAEPVAQIGYISMQVQESAATGYPGALAMCEFSVGRATTSHTGTRLPAYRPT